MGASSNGRIGGVLRTCAALVGAVVSLLMYSPAAAQGVSGLWHVKADDENHICGAAAPIADGGGLALMAYDGELTFAVVSYPGLHSGKSGVFKTDLESFAFEPSFDDDVLYFNGWMSSESVATLRLAKQLTLIIDGQPIVDLALEDTGLGQAMDGVLDCSRGKAGWWGKGLDGVTDQSNSRELQARSGGTGFFVSGTGLAVTNNHVVASCRALNSPRWGAITVLATDEKSDLALIKTERFTTRPLQVRPRGPRLGEPVQVAGFPLTKLLGRGLKITNGSVSGLSGLGGDRSMFQFTAPIQPGNSGGPVVDAAGALIGVAAAKLDESAALEESGSLPQNVNFAVTGPVLLSFLEENGVDTTAADFPAPDLAAVTFFVECLG